MISSYCSANGGCVDVVIESNSVHVGDPHTPTPDLVFTFDEWAAFIAGVKNNEFDLPNH